MPILQNQTAPQPSPVGGEDNLNSDQGALIGSNSPVPSLATRLSNAIARLKLGSDKLNANDPASTGIAEQPGKNDASIKIGVGGFAFGFITGILAGITLGGLLAIALFSDEEDDDQEPLSGS